MGIREILHKELWSKATSRKILSVAGRALRIVEVFVVGFVVWYLVTSIWLTPSERKAGRAALEKIDALENSSGMSENEFAGGYKQAEAAVHAAQESAWTTRDESVATQLSVYLMGTEVRRRDQKFLLRESNLKEDDPLRTIILQGGHYSADEFESGMLHQALR